MVKSRKGRAGNAIGYLGANEREILCTMSKSMRAGVRVRFGIFLYMGERPLEEVFCVLLTSGVSPNPLMSVVKLQPFWALKYTACFPCSLTSLVGSAWEIRI